MSGFNHSFTAVGADHPPPHFDAQYGEYDRLLTYAVVRADRPTGVMVEASW
jgi:hypothetical protein